MSYNRKTKLMTVLLSGAAATAIVGLSAVPAHAASVSSTKFTVTLTGSNGASVDVCYTLTPSTLDVNEDIKYTEKVDIWGSDDGEFGKGGDDHLVSVYSGSRTFSSTTPITNICRTKSFSDRKTLNDDTGTGKDELYAKIRLVPVDPQLKTVTKKTAITSLHI